MASVIKRRNLFLQILWTLLTVGIYAFYWYYETCREMADYLKRDESVGLWSLLLGFPPLCLYSYYKQGELFEEVTKGNFNRWLAFVLWLFFPPGIWIAIQLKLNEIADQNEKAAIAGV